METVTEKPQRLRQPLYAAGYTVVLPHLVAAARECGYALALHGSMATDLDLIAVPWIEQPKPAEELVEALKTVVGGYFLESDPNPRKKLHGRLCWSIYFPHGGCYIDLSIMPIVKEPQ